MTETALACPSCRLSHVPGISRCPGCGEALVPPTTTTFESLEFVVLGQPIPQGSLKAIAAGVVASDNPKLRGWRRDVNKAALAVCGADWEAWDGPLALDAVYTLARPKGAPKTRITFPAVKPDLDKLTRAIGDSLCPKTGLKVIVEDSRIVEFGQAAKTYPIPYNTHPGALTEPGVRIRVRRLTPPPPPADLRAQAARAAA